ncbi:MAG TPA: murein biosynthesis integral membrane protein MurJ [Thermoleophilia bacterium]|nr:murein biosynthesis integral membrane protein MurJ [Thermoleophilia bacterium]
MSDQRRLAASTATFGVATAASRVAGLVRDSAAAYFFGTSAAMSAFTIAFNIPNLVRALVGDSAIGGAFVPVFVEMREQGRELEAWRVASILFWLAAVVLGGISALFVVLAPWLMPLLLAGQNNVSTSLVVELTRWLFPIVVLLGLSGIVTAILNSYEIFGLPAFAPVIWNIVIIGFLIGFAHSIRAYAIGVLVATVVQLLVPLPLLRRCGPGLAFRLTFGNPEVNRILRLMLPVILGLGLINVNLTVDLLVAPHASSHANADLNYAFRLFMLPQGLFSVAVSTVLFPEISRMVARGDTLGFIQRVAEGMRTIAFLLLPAAAISVVMASPIVRLIYQHRAFGPLQTSHVSAVLIAFSLGLVFNGYSLLLTRAFFALKLPMVPTRVAVVNLILNAVLDIALAGPLGAAGIALSTSVVTTWNALVLAYLLRRQVGSLQLRAITGEGVRIGIATAYCAVTAFGLWWGLDRMLGRSIPAQVVSVGVSLAASGAIYLTAGRLLALSDVGVLDTLMRRARS